MKKMTSNHENRIMIGQKCPLTMAMDVISGRWKAVILYRLIHQDMGFHELHRSIVGVSEKVLARQLSALAKDQLIEKQKQALPEKTVYSLSERGHRLKPILLDLSGWAKKEKLKPF